jgi:hypothetical protein
MLVIHPIDPRSRADVRRFVRLPHLLYSGDPNWVPPPDRDVAATLSQRDHPFYEHSDAAFFLAVRDGRPAGRIAALEHRPYNRTHGVRQVWFALFECDGAEDTATALFARVFEWARGRGLDQAVGPRGFSAFDGYGLLADGFDRRQLMTMTGYNPASYPRLVESLGFEREVDFISYLLRRNTFVMPEVVRQAAERATRRLTVFRYPSTRALVAAAPRIGAAYNRAFVDNWEYYPISDREIAFLVGGVRLLANPRLMTFITAGDDLVAFALAFPDVSAALQRMAGRVTPWGLVRLLAERGRTASVAINGAGIVPEHQGRGGNALLYLQLEHAIRQAQFQQAELTQVADTAVKMRHDLERLGAEPIKRHRVYRRGI